MPTYYILTNSIAETKKPIINPIIKGSVFETRADAENSIWGHARRRGEGRVLIKLECDSKDDLKELYDKRKIDLNSPQFRNVEYTILDMISAEFKPFKHEQVEKEEIDPSLRKLQQKAFDLNLPDADRAMLIYKNRMDVEFFNFLKKQENHDELLNMIMRNDVAAKIFLSSSTLSSLFSPREQARIIHQHRKEPDFLVRIFNRIDDPRWVHLIQSDVQAAVLLLSSRITAYFSPRTLAQVTEQYADNSFYKNASLDKRAAPENIFSRANLSDSEIRKIYDRLKGTGEYREKEPEHNRRYEREKEPEHNRRYEREKEPEYNRRYGREKEPRYKQEYRKEKPYFYQQKRKGPEFFPDPKPKASATSEYCFIDGDKIDFNPYEVLGVDQNATDAEIKKAYFKKARDLHPDKGISVAGDRFKNLGVAQAILLDSNKRAEYDDFLNGNQPGMRRQF